MPFKEFVEGGGYEQRELWQHPFVNDGQVLPWDEAMSRFRDQTGRPGPSTWQVGSYPDGQEDYPVGGVSWYEAAAYAEFRGESLPTIYHWVHAADPNLAAWVTPLSNFGGEGPSSIGTAEGVSAWGTYDMAGNVREWVWNEAEPGRTRYILGGSWGDQDYQFHHADAQSPFDRSPQNGFRLARYSGEQPTTEALTRPVRGSFRDYTEEESVSDEVFEGYRNLYSYDPTPLDPRVDLVEESELWRREAISFNASYGDERVAINLFLPGDAQPPYQTVISFPTAGAITDGAFEEEDIRGVQLSHAKRASPRIPRVQRHSRARD